MNVKKINATKQILIKNIFYGSLVIRTFSRIVPHNLTRYNRNINIQSSKRFIVVIH